MDLSHTAPPSFVRRTAVFTLGCIAAWLAVMHPAGAAVGPPTSSTLAPASAPTGDPTASVGLSANGVTVQGADGSDPATLTPVGGGALGPWRTGAAGTATTTRDGVSYKAVADGSGVAIGATLANAGQATDLAYDLTLPAGAILQPTDGGGFDIVDPNGVTVGQIAPPWAQDAHGASVPTSYRAVGTRLHQVVDVDAQTAFPVVADPKYTWGIISGTVYFNITETVDAKSVGGVAGTICTALGLLSGGAGAALSAWCLVEAGIIAYDAIQARNNNKCIDVKYYVVAPFSPEATSYSGGYCTK